MADSRPRTGRDDSGMNKSMIRRSLFVGLALLLCFVAVFYQLIKIMLVDSDFYRSKTLGQQLRETVIPAKRGNIYDCNMEILAESATVYTIYVSPNEIAKSKVKIDVDKLADGLSEILDVDRKKIIDACNKSTSYYEIIKKQVENQDAEKVRQFIADNSFGGVVGIDTATKRYYPNGSLASTVLGFVGNDNNGLSGIEYQYDEQLKGSDGKEVALKNAQGSNMPFTYEELEDATDGNSLVLTIDEGVQYYIEKYLDEAVKDNKVENRATAIVMNVKTGEILAMATKGDYDPNNPFKIADSKSRKEIEKLSGKKKKDQLAKAQAEQWRNKAVSETYVPGSVFKIFTGSAAYEENIVNEHSTFSCPGYIKVADTTIKCHNTAGHGTQTLEDAYVHSCNPAFIQIGQKLGVDNFFKYFKAFGFTEKTGIDLPGETNSIYVEPQKMGPVELASESFGQTESITPIQMITAVAAVANGGNLLQPHVVKQVLDTDGNVIENKETVVKRQVISKDTADAISLMLEQVVVKGSGKNAAVTGYRIAGKTGTSEKISEYVQTGIKRNVASFCGYAPVEDPQIAILVVLDAPTGASTFGGVIATPVAGEMFEAILPYLGIEPNYSEDELKDLDVTTPSVTGDKVADAKNKITSAGLKVSVVGDGKTVKSQNPVEGTSIPKGGTVVLYTEKNSSKVTVPDFSNMTVSEVNSAAAANGINIRLAGSSVSEYGAYAYKQSVESKTKVDKGTIVTVYFRVNDNVQ